MYLFTFRSKFHLGWFLATATTALASATFPQVQHPNLPNLASMLTVCGFMLITHVRATIAAAIVTLWKREPSEMYSKDCIWYNALLAIMYTIFIIQLI